MKRRWLYDTVLVLLVVTACFCFFRAGYSYGHEQGVELPQQLQQYIRNKHDVCKWMT